MQEDKDKKQASTPEYWFIISGIVMAITNRKQLKIRAVTSCSGTVELGGMKFQNIST